MYLGIMDGIRDLYYKADLRMAEKKADKVVERESKKMDQELAELRELVQYPDETIKWLQFCSLNMAVDDRLTTDAELEKIRTNDESNRFKRLCRESYVGSKVSIAAIAAYLGKVREGFICWPKEHRLAQSAIHKFLRIPVFPEYDDFTEEEIPDITEFSEYGNKWGIYIDDYVLSKAYDIVQQGTASKKFVSDIKNGLFMIIDNKLIEQQQADTTSVDL